MKISRIIQIIGEYEIKSQTVFNKRSDEEVTHVCSDSRSARHGCVFVCVSGAFRDGHEYASAAVERGASVIITEKPLDGIPYGTVIIKVKDSRQALAVIAGEFFGHPDKDMCVIGITGTKGKTSVALTAKHILEKNGYPCGYIGTNGIIFNQKHIEAINTTPDAITIYEYLCQMRKEKIRFVIIEISSQALWQSRVFGLNFEICVFTNISEDHIGGIEHPTFEHYMECKAKLFTEYAPRHIIYNADDQMFLPIIEGCTGSHLHPYSINTRKGLFADEIASYKNGGRIGVRFDAIKKQKAAPFSTSSQSFDIPIPGIYSVYNALAAILIGRLIGISSNDISSALTECYISGRFECIPTESKPEVTFVIDYAHNRTSLESVLKTLGQYPHNRIITVIGSVGGRTYGRRKDLGEIVARYSDIAIFTADNPDYEPIQRITGEMKDAFVCFADQDRCLEIYDRKEAIAAAFDMAQDGDIVLFAGKGHETYQLIHGRRVPFSEKEIIMNIDFANKPLPVLYKPSPNS